MSLLLLSLNSYLPPSLPVTSFPPQAYFLPPSLHYFHSFFSARSLLSSLTSFLHLSLLILPPLRSSPSLSNRNRGGGAGSNGNGSGNVADGGNANGNGSSVVRVVVLLLLVVVVDL